MPIIQKEDIRGYRVGEEMVCIKHATDHEAATAKIQDIIFSDDIEKDDDHVYYCDRCGEPL